MSRFGETKVVENNFMGHKKPIIIWAVNDENIIISNLIEMNNNSKYLIGYLDEVIKLLVLISPKMIVDVMTFNVGDIQITCLWK